jgi:hypothetical protein
MGHCCWIADDRTIVSGLVRARIRRTGELCLGWSLRGIALCFGRERVAAEGGYGDSGDDYGPGYEENPSGVEEKRVSRHKMLL